MAADPDMKRYKLKLTGVADNQPAIAELSVGESVAVFGDAADPLHWVVADRQHRPVGELPRKNAYLDFLAEGWEITGAEIYALVDPTEADPIIGVTVRVTIEDLREIRRLRAQAEAMLDRFREEGVANEAAAAPVVAVAPAETAGKPKGIWSRLFGSSAK